MRLSLLFIFKKKKHCNNPSVVQILKWLTMCQLSLLMLLLSVQMWHLHNMCTHYISTTSYFNSDKCAENIHMFSQFTFNKLPIFHRLHNSGYYVHNTHAQPCIQQMHLLKSFEMKQWVYICYACRSQCTNTLQARSDGSEVKGPIVRLMTKKCCHRLKYWLKTF